MNAQKNVEVPMMYAGFSRKERAEKAQELLEIVEMGDRGKHLPEELSGGQKQRVSIARAYIKEAPIMIMDDSVSAVDVKTEETILENIKNERAGKTTLVIASRVSTVMHMDKILVLSEGSVEAFGTHQELLKTSKIYQRMVFLQELEKEVEGGAN
jgi:ATP-binding cassette subfamily B protein